MGAWIEILYYPFNTPLSIVAPLVGAWIEIKVRRMAAGCRKTSLLSWERGLKLTLISGKEYRRTVAPLVGAWIEIQILKMQLLEWHVAPLVGAWIEIFSVTVTIP